MIPQAFIREWSQYAPWKSNEQIEQDLLICREHFTVLGYKKFPFEVNSSWFSGKCDITTYRIEELLGTKLRALYQRSKGRDLYDLYLALTSVKNLDKKLLLECYKEYMSFSVSNPPSMREFVLNLEEKMKDSDFVGDTSALLRIGFDYDPSKAYNLIRSELLSRLREFE